MLYASHHEQMRAAQAAPSRREGGREEAAGWRETFWTVFLQFDLEKANL
jgi:hypothetical protein